MRKRVDASSEICLLYPPGKADSAEVGRWGRNAVEDLEIERLAWELSLQNDYQEAIKSVLLELNPDTDTIEYRQEVLADFLGNTTFSSGLEAILTSLGKLRDYADTRFERTPLRETLARLSELNTYATCVRSIHAALNDSQSDLTSRGLISLREWVEKVVADEVFQSLEKELPDLLSKLSGFPSISIGVNLDSQLRPIEATILAIHEKPFKGGKFMDKVMGRRSSGKPTQGIGPLHAAPRENMTGLNGLIVPLPTRVDPLMVPLFRDLYEMLRWLVTPINDVLKQFAAVNIGALISLETEIAFYLGAARLVHRMVAAGLPMCRPKALASAERSARIEQMYNLFLALRTAGEEAVKALSERIVLNDVNFGPEGKIFILTGPNLGGKTVYTQAVGAIQVLFQAGLNVPAERAEISPVDGIFTHFARLEQSDSGMGRLGEEAERLNEIFQQISGQSLVLLNESLASTSPAESLFLARDVVSALRLFGVRAIFATHLHELGLIVDELNAKVKGDSKLISLVAGVAHEETSEGLDEEMVARTYQIKAGPPLGLSYARGIASRYGISYEQLAGRWKEKQAS